jgi:hypothetical protein
MELNRIAAVDINNGEQNADGTYVKVHEDCTICEPCIRENGWGFTTFADSVPKDTCDLCGN